MMKKTDENLIEEIVSLMRRDESFDAPPDSVKWAKNLFRARVPAAKTSFVKRILAVLQTDLQPNQMIFGERSAASGAARRMFFAAGDGAVDLRVTETTNGFSLRGQILGEDFAGSSVKLGEFETRANELSEFELANIPSGEYELILQTVETEITVENLIL